VSNITFPNFKLIVDNKIEKKIVQSTNALFRKKHNIQNQDIFDSDSEENENLY